LADDVVDLVRAGVGAILAFEIDARAADMIGETRREIERCGARGIMLEHGAEFGHETGIVLGFSPRGFEIRERGDQGFADIASAVRAEVAGGVGVVADEGCIHGRG